MPTQNSLTEYDFGIAIDTSGSMDEPNKASNPKGPTRWDAVQESAMTFARDIEKLDSDGIDVVMFGNGRVASYKNVTSAKLREIFSQYSPRGGTPTTEAVKEMRSIKGDKKRFWGIFTDGEPADRASLASELIDAANSIEKDEDLTFLFAQVGDDSRATAFLASLDDDLTSKGAKFDIVDCKTVEQIDQFATTTELILAAIDD